MTQMTRIITDFYLYSMSISLINDITSIVKVAEKAEIKNFYELHISTYSAFYAAKHPN
jgi:hypothetical protein